MRLFTEDVYDEDAPLGAIEWVFRNSDYWDLATYTKQVGLTR